MPVSLVFCVWMGTRRGKFVLKEEEKKIFLQTSSTESLLINWILKAPFLCRWVVARKDSPEGMQESESFVNEPKGSKHESSSNSNSKQKQTRVLALIRNRSNVLDNVWIVHQSSAFTCVKNIIVVVSNVFICRRDAWRNTRTSLWYWKTTFQVLVQCWASDAMF